MATETPVRNEPKPNLLRLRVLLTLEGCRTSEIAAMVGVAHESVTRILAGKQVVSADLLSRIELAIINRAHARVEEERRAQGLPATVQDPGALRAVAGLVGGGGVLAHSPKKRNGHLLGTAASGEGADGSSDPSTES